MTCSGETVIQKVEFNQGDGAYSKSFSVTYKPQNDTKPTIESLTCNGTTLKATEIQNMMSGTDKCVTFTVSPWINDNDTTPKVTGTATEISMKLLLLLQPSARNRSLNIGICRQKEL